MKLSKTMAILLLLPFSFTFFQNGFSQCNNAAVEYIAANRVKATVLNTGDFFWDRDYNGKFLTPYSLGLVPPPTTIGASALWLGGLDENGNLKTACQMEGNAYFPKRTDFWPGPINENTDSVFTNGCQHFDFIWKTNRGDILQAINDFTDNGIIDSPVPFSIEYWPAKGNPHFEGIMGFELPNQELAPFFDRDNNGLYEPEKGDYPVLNPILPDIIPDEMTWCVFNDIQDVHTESNGQPLGVEVHFMTYAFHCSENELLNHTVFTKHTIINKSNSEYSGFKMALWADYDLGCPHDDFFGCDTLLNTVYFYNQNNVDSFQNHCWGAPIYGQNPPVQAITFLNHPMTNLQYFNRWGATCDPAFIFLPPNYSAEFYNNMSSKWRDGTPLTYGSYGYDTDSDETVNYAFFDNPSDPDGWALPNVNWLFICNYHTVMTATPDLFKQGQKVTLDAAFSFHRQKGANYLENVDVALDNILSIQNFYDSGFSHGCPQIIYCDTACVWPGDANRDGIAKNNDLLYLGVAMGKDAIGPERAVQSAQWVPQFANDWNLIFPEGMDYRNADFNGDGKLDYTDMGPLNYNYRKTTPGYVPSEMQAPLSTNELYLEISRDSISTTGVANQRRVWGNILLASEDYPIQKIYGIAFLINYDTSIWEQPISAMINLDNSSLFGNAEEVLVIGKADIINGWIEIAFSRKDGQPIYDAHGKLGRITLAIREDAPTGNPNGIQNLSFQFYDAVGVDEDGNLFELGAASDIVVGKDMLYDSTLISNARNTNNGIPLSISPNPNKGSFNLFFEKTTAGSQISLFDLNGKMVWSGQIPAHTDHYFISPSGKLATGVYFLKWVLADGQFISKKVIVE